MKVRTIQIAWYGAYSYNPIQKTFESKNQLNKIEYGNRKGLYQIYGRHVIYGDNSLLYIGQTIDSFYSRISKHNDNWMYMFPGDCEIYLGQILKTHDNNDPQELQIDQAEKILIDFYKPSQNILLKNGVEEIYSTLIINYGNIGKIERIIGTTYYEAESWKHENSEDLFFKQ